MRAAAFASWVRQLGERDFDAPFISLLRAQGFYDIHFTHGNYEFGKDFVAKRNEPDATQYAFQSKAGDIGSAEWAKISTQLEELADEEFAPPGFDPHLPRKAVLVTTGRLTGKATIAPTTFRNRLRKTGRGEFEVWDADTLAELLDGSPRFPLGPTEALREAFGLVEVGAVGERVLERSCAHGCSPPPQREAEVHRLFVDYATLATALADRGWPFLALTTVLNELRLGAIVAHRSTDLGREVMRGALDHYVALGKRLLAALLENAGDSHAWADWVGGSPPRMVGYAVACAKTMEFLSLASLSMEALNEVDSASRFADLCARVASSQPGCAHPVSDRFAASYPPTVAVLVRHGRGDVASSLVRNTTKWVCDRYESGLGLAGSYSSPDEEVRTLLGVPFECVGVEPRRESLLSVALADSASVFLPEDYPAIVNDIRAVGIVPVGLHAKDAPNAYLMNAGETLPIVNPSYPDAWSDKPLAHHALQPGPRTPEALAGAVVPLALACVLRDRLFTDVLPRLRDAPLKD